MRDKLWNRCDIYGKFIAFRDFDKGATRVIYLLDSYVTIETYETLCKKHNKKGPSLPIDGR